MILLFAAALAGPPAYHDGHAATPEAGDAPVIAAVRALEDRVSALRGLRFTAPVPVSVQSEEEVRQTVLDDLRDPEAVQDFEDGRVALTAFGIVGRGFDLRGTYVEAMTASLGGWYDTDVRELVLVRRKGAFDGDGVADMGEDAAVAAHELVHVLQDQTWDLWQLRNREYDNSDVASGILGLTEGDASWTMTFFEWPADKVQGLTALPHDDFASFFAGVYQRPPSSSPVGRMPVSLWEPMLYPYSWGLAFAKEVYAKGGWDALNAAYARPPLSTEQIIHPERYLSDTPDWPIALELPDLAAVMGADWELRYDDTMGEIGVRALFADWAPHLDDTARADLGTGWGGDRYAILSRADGARDADDVATWATTWDSEADAQAFEEALAAIFRGQSRAERTLAADGSRLFISGPIATGLRREGTDVLVVIGAPKATVPRLLTALRDLPRRRLTHPDDVAPPTDERRKADMSPEERAAVEAEEAAARVPDTPQATPATPGRNGPRP